MEDWRRRRYPEYQRPSDYRSYRRDLRSTSGHVQQFELGQVGPGLAILRNAQTIDATEGEIETIVDEKVNRFKVRITSPITGESKRFTFEGV